MALLTSLELAELRRDIENRNITPDLVKTILNSGLQAVEDWFESNRSSLNTAINTATAPIVLTLAQKKLLVAVWLKQKYGREGV